MKDKKFIFRIPLFIFLKSNMKSTGDEEKRRR